MMAPNSKTAITLLCRARHVLPVADATCPEFTRLMAFARASLAGPHTAVTGAVGACGFAQG